MRRTSRGVSSVMLTATVVTGLVLGASPAQAYTVTHEYAVPTLDAGPFGATLGSDGNVWFVEFDGNAIGKITTAGVVAEYPIPTADSDSESITAGPDGNLWFTEDKANKIGRITTSGVFTEFPIPTANSGVSGIAPGPDGRLWFTEFGSNKIGRITTSGTFSKFPIPTANSGPAEITAGPDNNMWFTEYNASQVARITTSGVVTEFASGTGTGPYGIAAGPDGNMWVTHAIGNGIIRMTTAGAITGTFAVTGGSTPYLIAAGPDGSLWFTEFDGNNVGQITTSGTVTEIPVPTAQSEPFGIAPGSDGNMWFTEYAGNNIGTIALPHFNLLNVFYIPNFFIKKVAPVANQGDTVSWLMLDPGIHGVADSSGMGLFGYGPTGGPTPIGMGQVFSFRFIAAGTYPYNDPFHASSKGRVKVPIAVQPVVGTTNQAQVTWSSAEPPVGFAFDVQVEQPGSSSFVDWRVGVAGPTAAFGPSDPLYVGPGTYRFRSRMRNTSNGAASGYSAPKSIMLT
jgi:streptogramin lyase